MPIRSAIAIASSRSSPSRARDPAGERRGDPLRRVRGGGGQLEQLAGLGPRVGGVPFASAANASIHSSASTILSLSEIARIGQPGDQPRRRRLPARLDLRSRRAGRGARPRPPSPRPSAAAARRGRPGPGCRTRSRSRPRPARWFSAEPWRPPGRAGSTVDLPREDAAATRSVPRRRCFESAARPRARTSVSPSAPPTRSPRAPPRPAKSATNAEARARRRARPRCPPGRRARVEDGDPVGEQRRLREVVGDDQRRHPALGQQLRELAPAAARVRASSADSGSSSSSARGSAASARARATRWRSPPESSRGPRVGRVGEPEALEQLQRRVAPLAPARPRIP